MTAPSSDTLPAVEALSPVDGRYRAATAPLRAILSEAGLIRERVRVEARWLLHLAAAVPELSGAKFTQPVRERALQLIRETPADAAESVKAIEARINHDVKAVEYYVRAELQAAGALEATLELVHFGCTSEDINNLAYALMMQRARENLLQVLGTRRAELVEFAHRYAAQPMLSRTHGQPASPTTLGKEFANFAARLQAAMQRWQSLPILGKWNGAVGNFNAHVAVLPGVDWARVSREFVISLGLQPNPYTTQIEPHDWLAAWCDALAGINVILIDLARDIWGYISLGYLRQRAVAGEVGSSTMPHKVNPIDFENAEGNLGVANALLRHFSDKLPISRWQRDLTDSTVLRNVGVALGHSLIAWSALGRGLSKVASDPQRIGADISAAWEVLGEAVQTVLRASGSPGGYERLKDFTRGRGIDAQALAQFIDTLPLPAAERERLKALRPETYVGLAETLARQIS
jgi:adenylosuccinate lyase